MKKGLVGQWRAKLLAIKVEVLKKKSATLAIPAELCAIAFGQCLNAPMDESFSKFDGGNFTAY